jgi:transcriptional regulator with XRE-family HTH domain
LPARRPPSTVEELRNALIRSAEDAANYERAYVRVAVSNFLQTLRVSARLTQTQLAELAGTTQSEVSRIERAAGPRAPELATLVRFARACGYDLSFLATPRPPRKRRTRKVALLSRADV